ncbi:transposase for IS1330 [Shigella boydii 965-58]|nr:transposase for IS1330 [Shigella boydii 965-58]
MCQQFNEITAMPVHKVCQNFFRDALAPFHQYRQNALMDATVALINGASLTLTSIGRFSRVMHKLGIRANVLIASWVMRRSIAIFQ